MRIRDAVTIGDARISRAGYLEANARCVRTGVQEYLGSEVGKPEMGVVRVYRDEAEVFSKTSLQSFSKIPVTVDHPGAPVTADNWRAHARGTTGDEVLRDGEYLKIGIKITDAEAVQAVRDGKAELSAGYSTDLVWGSGVTPDGEPYDARQTNIVADHIAVVDRARAGSECRIGDSAGAVAWGVAPINAKDEGKPHMATKTVMVDGIPVETTDAAAIVIDKLLKDRDAAEKALADADKEHDEVAKKKDKELAEKDAEIEKLKKDKLDDAAIDARVATRAKLIGDAAKLAKDAKFDGMSDADVRRAAVIAVRGEDAIKGRSDAYVEAAFDIAVADAKPNDDQPVDPFRKAMGDKKVDPGDNGQDAYEARLSDAWKNMKEGA